jgi:hypothetical protein
MRNTSSLPVAADTYPVETRPGWRWSWSFVSSLVVMCGLLLVGCSGEEPIRQYTVPKEEPPRRSVARTEGEQVWFFKLTGPHDDGMRYVKPFIDIVRTAQFEEGVPKYEVPEGWKVKAGPAPRHETITIPDTDPPLEVTVSSLPAPASDFDGYLKANIDRWREQIGLPPMPGPNWREQAEQEGEIITVPSGDRSITMVHLTGETETFGETRMLTAVVSRQQDSAPMQSGPGPGDAGSPARPATESPQLSYDTPEGWEPSRGSSMRLASFQVPHESGPSDLSVTRFPGGGDPLSNVNRWRSQIGLDPIDEQQLSETMEEVTVDAQPGWLVLLEGEEQAILAVTVDDDDAKWFFKLQGPLEGVRAEQENFRAFIASVKFTE